MEVGTTAVAHTQRSPWTLQAIATLIRPKMCHRNSLGELKEVSRVTCEGLG